MRTILRAALISASLIAPVAVVGLTPDLAWAGPDTQEIWFGTGSNSLETNENGQVTEEGKKTKTKEVDRIPGEDDWELKLHARMGKYAAEGPVYVEFFQTVEFQGKKTESIVYRHEDPDYGGERLYTTTILLEANIGFNKDREYRVQIIQNNGKRDLVLAKGKVKLIDTGREPEPAEGESEGEEGPSEQDIADTLAGGEDEGEDEGDELEDEGGEDEGAADGEAPPPVEEPGKKKGCSVGDVNVDLGFSGMLVLLLAAAATRRRREQA